MEHSGLENPEISSGTPEVNRLITSKVIIEKPGVSGHPPKECPVVVSGKYDNEPSWSLVG